MNSDGPNITGMEKFHEYTPDTLNKQVQIGDHSIDGIYCINLERRADRWEKFKALWDPYNLKISRFAAVDMNDLMFNEGEYANHNAFHNLGSVACTLSHIQVLERAMYSGQKEILILEDDATPCSGFIERFNKAYADLPEDYQFCYLGGSNMTAPEPVTENIGKPTQTKSTVAYLIKTSMAESVIALLKKFMLQNVIDELYAGLQIHYPQYFFITTPRLIHQYEDYSDILGANVDYHWQKDLD